MFQRPIPSSRGFTLIELLIVVAIIAILAAIAVPNFLEAQTRAKVSRAHSDLRTVATALESYAVDNNTYPFSDSFGGLPWLLPSGYPRANANERPGGLTTPIAYLTSGPIDPFEHEMVDSAGNKLPARAELYFERAGFGYVDGVKTIVRAVPTPSDAVGNGSLIGLGPSVAVTDPQLTPAAWILWSAGPDRNLNVLDGAGNLISNSRYFLDNRYDPTNGTVSVGNVVRLPGGRIFPGS